MSVEYVLNRRNLYDSKTFKGCKNLMVFVTGTELIDGGWEFMKDDDYFDKSIRYMKAQIDNSLYLGWKTEDIILATNFDFEYRGVKNYKLEDTCDYSQFYNKEYAISEVIRKGIAKDTNIFYHDLDAFQLTSFEFPEFDGDIAGCVYPDGDGHSVQCGVLYFKTSAGDMMNWLVDGMKKHQFDAAQGNDEIVIRHFIKMNPEYLHRFSTLDTSWNVGMTGFAKRIRDAIGEPKVCHFHPDNQKCWDVMVEGKNEINRVMIDDRLKDIILEHDLGAK